MILPGQLMMPVASGLEIVATNSNTVSGSTSVVDLPLGIQAGDLIVVALAIQTDRTATTPSGWTKLITDLSADPYLHVFTKTATGTEGATQSFTMSGTAVGVAIVVVVRGSSTNIASAVGRGITTSDAPSVAAPTPGILMVFASLDIGSVDPSQPSAPSGMTLLVPLLMSSSIAHTAFVEEVTAGATGIRSVTWNRDRSTAAFSVFMG